MGVDEMRAISSERFFVLAQYGLFDEHELVGLKLFDQYLRHGPVHPAMKVHADAYVGSHGLAHCSDVLQAALHLVEGVDILHLFGAIHLHRGEAARHRVPAPAGSGFAGAVAANPAIDPDAARARCHPAARTPAHRGPCP